jgi:hypothetical protein
MTSARAGAFTLKGVGRMPGRLLQCPPSRISSFLAAGAIAAVTAAPALAADPPKLPASAMQVPGPKIAALYDGKTFAYRTYTFFGVVTGEVTYDFKTNTNHGTYRLGWHRGTFDGQISVSGDKFCYKTSSYSERCNYVYADGDELYEVKPSGIVDSVNEAK